MTKELARYFLVVIDRDLYFSFNGMGLPNSAYEWLENQLMKENFDKVEEFIKIRYDERENKRKKKRKFRAMTYGEFCDKFKKQGGCCIGCPFLRVSCTKLKYRPCKPYGKYILVEVKE
jgi:hypothetical protein